MTHDCEGIVYNNITNKWQLDNHTIRYCPFCGKDLIRVTCKDCTNYDFDDELQPNNRKHPRSGTWKHKCKAGLSDRFSCATRCKSCFRSNNKM